MKLLARIEKLGNRLPDPVSLFVIGTVFIMLLSHIATLGGWVVDSELSGELQARSMLSSEGIWWLLSHLVENFINFPPLAIVLVGMLGIGLAEATGLLSSMLRYIIMRVPACLLTPATMFVGIMSSVALDAGYVILPPVAAALYQTAGRSPLVGIAVVFAGVSAGFSANLFITALDPLLGGLTQAGAQIIKPDYVVAVTANWWFMIVSTVLLTAVGWMVTAWFVEPGLENKRRISPNETKNIVTIDNATGHNGLRNAVLAICITLVIIVCFILVPGLPLYGHGIHFDRWVEVTIPLLFILFFIPGIVYGISAGVITNDRDIARIMGETLARLGPYIVLAFFAAQFIESFKYSGLGEMLAFSGGQLLSAWQIPDSLLLCSFLIVVMLANLLIGSASAKYAFFAPVFVPMFMQVGISPELTQAAYRVGDSISNTITPMNPYMVIILVHLQRYVKGSGIGTLIALMLPYTIVFAIAWTTLLLTWLSLGLPLGPGGPLHFTL
ncbi:MAG: AbgT family transporter [Proteobacteria bacterium]|nr:AbgT family transporter [Pseudomonadota bacterium]